MPKRTLEDLVVKLSLDNRALRQKLRISSQDVGTNARQMEGNFKRVGRSFKQFATQIPAARLAVAGLATAGGAGIAALARRMTEAARQGLIFADSIDKQAGKVGVGVEKFQEYVFAADQAGIAQTTLSQAIQRYTRRAGEAAVNTGEARGAIAELGIELTDAEGRMRSTSDLFEDAMRALARIDDPARRLRLAFKLFDSEGAVLVNLADDFEVLTEKAREMGVVIDASTIAKAVEAKDKLAALEQVTRAQLTVALVNLAPVLTTIAEAFAGAATQVATFFAQIKNVRDLGTIEAQLALEKTEERITKLRSALDEALGGRGVTRTEIEGGIRPDVQILSESLQIATERAEELREQLRSLQTPDNQPSTLPPVVPPGETLKFTDAELGLTKRRTRETFETIRSEARETQDSLGQLFDFAASGWAGATADMVLTGEASFEQIANSFIREVLQRAFQPGFEQIFGLLQQLTGLAGGIGQAATPRSFSNVQLVPRSDPFAGSSSFNANLQGLDFQIPVGTRQPIIPRAGGGNIGRGRFYRVGENGPEIITATGPGFVTPNGQTPGQTNVIINNFSKEEATVSERETASGIRELEVSIGRAVAKDIRGNGPVSSAIADTYGIGRVGQRGV